MRIFVRQKNKCRERCYQTVWECKTGNLITFSTVSKEKCIRKHIAKMLKSHLQNVQEYDIIEENS